MKIDLKEKNALVGGSSKGIGKAIAERLAASGANVTLMARDEKKLNEIVQSLDKKQGQNQQSLIISCYCSYSYNVIKRH